MANVTYPVLDQYFTAKCLSGKLSKTANVVKSFFSFFSFFLPGDHFLVEKVVVFFGSDDPSEEDFFFVDGESAVRVVEDDLDVGGDDARPRPLVQKGLTLFRAQVRVLIAQHELYGVEEVGLSGPVSTDDDVVARVEGLDHRLLAVTLESLNDHLLDVHDGLSRRPLAFLFAEFTYQGENSKNYFPTDREEPPGSP